MVVHICNLCIWEVKARKSGLGHPQLHNELNVSLSYTKLCFKKEKKEKKVLKDGMTDFNCRVAPSLHLVMTG